MPTRNQVCAWGVGVGLLVPSPGLAQDRTTEREIVEQIVREGPQARAIDASVEVARREQAVRLGYPNPTISYSREGVGFTEFLQVEQTLPLPGLRSALARAGVAAGEVAEAERDARLWTLRSEAASTVSRAAAADARLDIATQYATQVQQLVEILRIREREGEGSRFDRVRAEHELRDAELAAMTAAVEVADARAALGTMLPDRYVVGAIAWAPAPRPVPVLEVLMTRAASARADLRAVDRSAGRAELEAVAAGRVRMPSPTLVGGVKRTDGLTGREAGGVFGISFTLPLIDAGGREAARWTAERERISAERLALDQRIRMEVTRAAAALARRQTSMRTSAAAADDGLLSMAEVAYREGEIGILEVLDAARAATRARSRHIDLQLDLRLAEIALERAVGDLLWP